MEKLLKTNNKIFAAGQGSPQWRFALAWLAGSRSSRRGVTRDLELAVSVATPDYRCSDPRHLLMLRCVAIVMNSNQVGRFIPSNGMLKGQKFLHNSHVKLQSLVLNHSAENPNSNACCRSSSAHKFLQPTSILLPLVYLRNGEASAYFMGDMSVLWRSLAQYIRDGSI